MSGRVIASSLAAALLVVRSTPAAACQPGPWTSAPAYAAPATLVPKNIPAVHAFPGFTLSGCQTTSVALTAAPSTPIALTPSAAEPNTFLLWGELEQGATYTLDYASTCLPTGPGQVSFVAGEARPLPLETGKLELSASGTGSVSWWDGACSWGVYAPWVRVRLRPSCDLVPFLPVTRFVAEVNGKVWWTSAVGSTTAGELADSRTVDLIYPSCGSPDPWFSTSGKAVITMRAHVVGAAIDPAPATLPVVFDCDEGDASSPPQQPAGGLVDLGGPCLSSLDASSPPPDAAPPDAAPPTDAAADAGSSDAGSAGDASPGTDAPAPREGMPELQPGGGCACGAGRSRRENPALLWIAAALAVWRRRRASLGSFGRRAPRGEPRNR